MEYLSFVFFLFLLGFFWPKYSSFKKRLTALEAAVRDLQHSNTPLQENYLSGTAAEEAKDTPPVHSPLTVINPMASDAWILADTPAAAPPETYPAPPSDSRIVKEAPCPRSESAEDRHWNDRSLDKAEKETFSPGFGAVLKNLFSGDHHLVKTGVVILFFGMAFLVKYAAEHGFLPPEVRLILAAVTGIALIVLGWILRLRRTVYGQILQGGGVGILYLTVYSAFRLYPFLPAETAFVLLVLIAIGSGILAVLHDSRPLAFLGSVGGFLAPVLVPADRDNHVILFSYYALLDACICAIAWFKAWRELNVVGFLFTFAVGAAWGVRSYQPDLFVSTEPFLILFFLLFVFIAVLFALRQPPHLKHYVDGTIVFGTPLLAFALQSFLVKPYHYGLAWSAAAAGAFYLLVAWILFRKRRDALRALTETFLAFGVLFITLAIPLAFTERWTSAVWALEGTGILWVGVRTNRLPSRLFGVILQGLSWLFFLADAECTTGSTAILNGFFLGGFLISLSAIASAYFYSRCDHVTEKTPEKILGASLFFIGFLAWFAIGIHEIDIHLPQTTFLNASLVFFAFSCGTTSYLKNRIPWQPLLNPSLLLLPAMAIVLVFGFAEGMQHPFESGGATAWIIAFTIQYVIFYQQRQSSFPMQGYHAFSCLLLTAVCTLEAGWVSERAAGNHTAWSQAMRGLTPAAFLFALSSHAVQQVWPVKANRKTYVSHAAIIVICYLMCWILYGGFAYPGIPDPLPYIPFLNPLDCTVMVSLVAMVFWFRRLAEDEKDFFRGKLPFSRGLFVLLVFYWFNTILLRAIHSWAHVNYSPEALFDSVLVQTSLSIFWTICALSTMLWASRKKVLGLWLGGMILLSATVLKLFLIDLSEGNTVERIVSFVVVGALLLVVGYFSPRPPIGRNRDQAF